MLSTLIKTLDSTKLSERIKKDWIHQTCIQSCFHHLLCAPRFGLWRFCVLQTCMQLCFSHLLCAPGFVLWRFWVLKLNSVTWAVYSYLSEIWKITYHRDARVALVLEPYFWPFGWDFVLRTGKTVDNYCWFPRLGGVGWGLEQIW